MWEDPLRTKVLGEETEGMGRGTAHPDDFVGCREPTLSGGPPTFDGGDRR